MRIMTVALLLGSISFVLAADPPQQRKPVVLTDAALELHRSCLVVDGHNDLPWVFREQASGAFTELDITRAQPKIHTDIPRLKKGGVGAQFWSAYVPVSTRKEKTAVRDTLEQIDTIHRMIKRYPETFELALTADDIVRIRKAGKIASLIGVEGGHSIDNSLGVLRILHQLGVRYMTLTHTETLDWADSATDEPRSKGLSEFGAQVIAEMNRLGMLVDISHVSVDTMKDALRLSKAPVIASHSSAFALCEHPRNVPDEVLKLLPRNGGVIMVNFYPGFLTPEGARFSKEMFSFWRDAAKKYPNDEERKLAWAQFKKEHPLPGCDVHVVVDHI
ncbi:MAG: dipeptidase, partial [Gemmataceae bacterium]